MCLMSSKIWQGGELEKTVFTSVLGQGHLCSRGDHLNLNLFPPYRMHKLHQLWEMSPINGPKDVISSQVLKSLAQRLTQLGSSMT